MFHTGMWRERLRNALTNMSDGTDYERPPANIDCYDDGLRIVRGVPVIRETAH